MVKQWWKTAGELRQEALRQKEEKEAGMAKSGDGTGDREGIGARR